MVALKAHIEFLKAEKKMIEKQLDSVSYNPQHFRIEISDDNLIRFYMDLFLMFFLLFLILGPSVNKLQYWGIKHCKFIKVNWTQIDLFLVSASKRDAFTRASCCNIFKEKYPTT